MAERDPIDLISYQLNRAEEMAGLHAGHESFKHWQSETKTVLEKVFGSRSINSQSFLALRFQEMNVKAFASVEIDKINASRYRKDLDHAKNILQSAIKELTLDRTLFKKIQTTPEKVDVPLKGEYFISSGMEDPDLIQAVKSAFEGSGLNPVPDIDSAGKGDLHQQISRIKRARFGIYDLSAQNRTHTLLEMGSAMGMGREVVIIHKKGFTPPDALRPFNPIEYENFTDLTEKLKKSLL